MVGFVLSASVPRCVVIIDLVEPRSRLREQSPPGTRPSARGVPPVIRRALGILAGVLCLSTILVAQQTAAGQPAGPVLKTLRIEGASIYSAAELASRARLTEGAPLSRTTDDIAADIRRRY